MRPRHFALNRYAQTASNFTGLLRGPLIFDLLDLRQEPGLDRLLQSRLIIFLFQRSNRLARVADLNVMARHGLGALFGGHEVNQEALAARARALRVAEVEAAQRALKD